MKKCLILALIFLGPLSMQALTLPLFSKWSGQTNGAVITWEIMGENRPDSFSLYDYSVPEQMKRYHLDYLRDSDGAEYMAIIFSISNNARMNYYKIKPGQDQALDLELLFKYHPPVVWHKDSSFKHTPVIIKLKRLK